MDAGILTIADRRHADLAALSTLHGMGPSAMKILRRALDSWRSKLMAMSFYSTAPIFVMTGSPGPSPW